MSLVKEPTRVLVTGGLGFIELCVKAEAIISFDKHFNNLRILRKDPCEVE